MQELFFLPQNTPVDPQTGSKYASEIRVVNGEERRVMIEDAVLVRKFVQWGSEKLRGSSPLINLFTRYKAEKNYYERERLRRECFTAFTRELEGLGFAPDAAEALTSSLISKLFLRGVFDQETLENIVRNECWRSLETR